MESWTGPPESGSAASPGGAGGAGIEETQQKRLQNRTKAERDQAVRRALAAHPAPDAAEVAAFKARMAAAFSPEADAIILRAALGRLVSAMRDVDAAVSCLPPSSAADIRCALAFLTDVLFGQPERRAAA